MSDFVDELAGLPPPVPPPIGDALEKELASLAPVATRRPLRQLATLAGLSVIYGAALVAALSMRPDMAELPMYWLLAAGLAWLAGFLIPAYLALVPRTGSMTTRWQWAAVAAVLSSIGFVLLGLWVHPSGPSSLQYNWEHFGRGHGCLWLGLGTALVPVTIGAIFLRGALPVGARWTAAGLGAGGGCLGGLVLHLHCPVTDLWHVGLIHGGVVAIAALLSAALVPRATDISAKLDE